MASAFSPPTSHHNHATHIASLHSERSISSSFKDQHPENIVSVLTKASNVATTSKSVLMRRRQRGKDGYLEITGGHDEED
jgi:hypothetical protein